MKRIHSIALAFCLSLAVLFCGAEITTAQSGYPHHPLCGGGHGGPPTSCWSYATSRAFGRGWTDPRCPAATFNSVNSIILDHFERFDLQSYSDVRDGDIIGWGQFTQPNHVAFITGVFSPSPSNIRVAQVENEVATIEQPNLWLSDVINGTGGAIARGNPTMFFRKRPRWSIRVQNSYGGGMVGVNGTEQPSGYIVSGLHWESSVAGVAVMDGRLDGGYIRRFRRWTGPDYIAYNATASLQVRSLNFNVVADFTAHLFKEYNVSFQISLPEATGGVIKVKDTIRVAPHQTTVIEDSASVTADAVYNEINRIKYTFAQWNDGSTVNPRTFVIGNHASYTAHYNAKPLHPANIYAGGPVGANVCVTWQEHPHPQVTQYQIWRKVKHQLTGTFSSPVLLTTVPRTTTQFIDYDYIVTDGYTHDLVWYDVRSYFSLNQTYSDPNWVAVFANGFFAKMASAGFVPSEWSVANSPNPFNPTTRITYSLPKDGFVSLVIYDVRGRELARLTDTYRAAGYYSILWNGKNDLGVAVGTGVYFARLRVTSEAGGTLYAKTIKLLLAK